MLFQRLPTTPSSGSGSHEGQKTGAPMRSASRCQPAAAFAGQRTFADALTVSLAPQPVSANTASARATSCFTAPLKPVNRDPGPRAPVPGLQVEDDFRPVLGRVVERRLARIVRPGGEHAVG